MDTQDLRHCAFDMTEKMMGMIGSAALTRGWCFYEHQTHSFRIEDSDGVYGLVINYLADNLEFPPHHTIPVPFGIGVTD